MNYANRPNLLCAKKLVAAAKQKAQSKQHLRWGARPSKGDLNDIEPLDFDDVDETTSEIAEYALFGTLVQSPIMRTLVQTKQIKDAAANRFQRASYQELAGILSDWNEVYMVGCNNIQVRRTS